MSHFEYDPADASNCVDPGTYDATIKKVDDQREDGSPLRAKSGEDMLKVIFTVYTPKGERTLSSYITAKKGLFRYRQLAQALGKSAEFTAKKFRIQDHVGANIQLALGKSTSPEYGEQNDIEQFLPGNGTLKKALQGAGAPSGGDDIPF